MGTPEFSVPVLERLVAQGHEIAAVYTRAPKPAGRRGLETLPSPVDAAAARLALPVLTPKNLKGEEHAAAFAALDADVAVVVAYGLILPKAILAAPRFGCLNLHASLLPRWRGAAPIQRAIMAGDSQTGVDVMRMDAGLDTGPIAMREIVAIDPGETAGDLTGRLAAIAARLSVCALQAMETGLLEFQEQSAADVCYAHKIRKSEAEIDWTKSAEAVRNQIHGLSPAPGALSRVMIGSREETIKFLRVEVTTATGSPGTLLSDDMSIACGAGAIRIVQAQRSGRATMSGGELMRGAKLGPGAIFRQSGAPTSVP